jgi:hypothetical protein
MTDDKNERAAKGELLTHGERQLKGQPRENQPAMVSDNPRWSATVCNAKRPLRHRAFPSLIATIL